MKPLIRPFLFAVARLGLFFAVVAWVVHSQLPIVWWQWNVPSLRGIPADSVVLVNADGLYSKYRYGSRFNLIASLMSGKDGGQEVTVVDAFGVKVVDDGQDRRIVIRHWLITSTFLAFNLMLHFVYRKRPEAEPCES